MHFSSALELSETDSLSKYNLFITEGHILSKKGNKEGLWKAIQLYYKASTIKPNLGDPYMYIGRAYHKLGDTEFDLIIEAYENALNLELTHEKKQEIEVEYYTILDRQKKLKEFWK